MILQSAAKLLVRLALNGDPKNLPMVVAHICKEEWESHKVYPIVLARSIQTPLGDWVRFVDSCGAQHSLLVGITAHLGADIEVRTWQGMLTVMFTIEGGKVETR